MKKLNLVLITLAILLTMTFSAFAVITPANVGPTTNFVGGDVGVATSYGYYINDTLILATDSLTFTGTGTLNGLDAVDATGEDTIEALIFDADAESITGVWEVQDDINLVFGNDANWAINFDESTDDQLLFITAGTTAGAVTDPLVEFIVGGSPAAGQQVFGISKGTQDSNTPLFTVDDDGDVLIPGTLGVTGAITLTVPLGAGQGGTGVANNAAETISLVGDDPIEFTTSGATTVTLPTTGTLATTADIAAAGNHVDHFMDVQGASATYCHAAAAGDGLGNDISVTVNPDVPRNVSITTTNNSTPEGNVTITGVLSTGDADTETIAVAAGTIAYGVKAWSTISKYNIPTGVDAGDTVSLGISTIIGLANAFNADADVYKTSINGVDVVIAANKIDPDYETIDFEAALVANSDVTVWYHP